MKTKNILLAIILLSSTLLVKAQTNSPQQSFFNQVFAWGTSFDTNNTTFLSTRGMLDTGVESRAGEGIPLINDIHASYDLVGSVYTAPTNTSVFRFGFDAVERNSGVTGTFVSGEAGPQVAIIHYDFRLGVSIDGGYWANSGSTPHHMFGEVCLDANKALGSRTYTGIRFAQEFPHSSQGIFAKLGFTF